MKSTAKRAPYGGGWTVWVSLADSPGGDRITQVFHVAEPDQQRARTLALRHVSGAKDGRVDHVALASPKLLAHLGVRPGEIQPLRQAKPKTRPAPPQ